MITHVSLSETKVLFSTARAEKAVSLETILTTGSEKVLLIFTVFGTRSITQATQQLTPFHTQKGS